jgi:hypothetical protein
MIRAEALEKILQLEEVIAGFKKRFHRAPYRLQELVDVGILNHLPEDPYGGTFYLDKQGKVRTTSKLAFGKGSSEVHNN